MPTLRLKDSLQPNQRHSIAISPVLDQLDDHDKIDPNEFNWGYESPERDSRKSIQSIADKNIANTTSTSTNSTNMNTANASSNPNTPRVNKTTNNQNIPGVINPGPKTGNPPGPPGSNQNKPGNPPGPPGSNQNKPGNPPGSNQNKQGITVNNPGIIQPVPTDPFNHRINTQNQFTSKLGSGPDKPYPQSYQYPPNHGQWPTNSSNQPTYAIPPQHQQGSPKPFGQNAPANHGSDRALSAPDQQVERPSPVHIHSYAGQPMGNESRSSSSPSRKKSTKKKRKVCSKCKQDITGQFVRALGEAFHVECFTCHKCGVQCLAKFFPYEVPSEEEGKQGEMKQVALCEYDYFKMLDLICHSCDSALRGPYITALGNKYHLEHFKCTVCQKVFESDESYYEHDGSIFCHYHYSKFYALHCEGCHSSIVKQFVELFKGGRNQQWHPECYMVHKFWNVCIVADSVGLQKKFNLDERVVLDLRAFKDGQLPENESDTSRNIDPKLLLSIEQQIESIVMQCWLTLSGYEETTAALISDMLFNAYTANQPNGLLATGKLILNVEVLFNALDFVNEISQRCSPVLNERRGSDALGEEEYFQSLKKEPRNISGKIMSYLAILRKSGQIPQSGSLSAQLLSVITGCAHYLKLLIRIGLNNALKVNKLLGTNEATETFLRITAGYERFNLHKDGDDGLSQQKDSAKSSNVDLVRSLLSIPPNATDACEKCSKSIEKMCIRFENKRWHTKCFECTVCSNPIALGDVSSTRYSYATSLIVCKECQDGESNMVEGFVVISDLAQLVYLLKIAISRSQAVMKVEIGKGGSRQLVQRAVLQRGAPVRTNSTKNAALDAKNAEDYSKTLNDVTQMRTRRQSQKLSNSIKQNARKSVILEAPQADKARQDEILDSSFENITEEIADVELEQKNRKASSASYLSFSQNDEELNVKKQRLERKDSGVDRRPSGLERRVSSTSKRRGSIREVTDSSKRNSSMGLSRKPSDNKRLAIRDEPQQPSTNTHLDRTTDLLKNEKSLTLDDIPRIVAAEQARDQRPNAFKHHNSLYQRQLLQAVKSMNTNGFNPASSPTRNLDNLINGPAKVSDVLQPPLGKKPKYYSELTKDEHFVMRHVAVEALVHFRGHKYNKEDMLQLIQTKKPPTFWDKFRFGGGEKKDKHMAVFGVELQDLTRKYGVDSDLGVGPSKLRIPIVVDDVINALKQKDMSVEGIFRLNGNIKRLRELTDEINKNPLKSPDFSSQTAVQLAALMKKWLRELPSPLLTYNLYDLWISSQSETNSIMRKRVLQLAYCMLPRSHRNLVEVLLSFFSWVGSFAEIDEETGSKMDIHNLATVVAPNILINKQQAASDSNTQSGDTYFLAIEVVNQLIEMHEEMSIIPDDLLVIFEKCGFSDASGLTTKDIMSKLEKALKEEPDFFAQYERNNPEDSVSNQMVHTNTISRGQSKVMNESQGETSRVE